MRVLFVVFFFLGTSHAAEIRGRLVNGTTGGIGEADEVLLVRHEEMMASVTAVENVRGSFVLKTDLDDPPMRFLVQATKGRVVYSQGVQSFDQEVVLTVFDMASEAEIQVSIDNLAVFAYGDRMDVGCFYTVRNTSQPPVVLEREGATLTFPLIDGTEHLEVSTKFGSAMSLRQKVEIDGQTGSLFYPLKPGQTQMIVTATRPYDAQNGSSFSLDLPSGQEAFHLVVLPRTMEVSGPGVAFKSVDEREDLNVYGFDPTKAGQKLVLNVRGTPADSRTPALKEEPAKNGEIRSMANSLDRWRWPITGAIVLLLVAAAARGLFRS